MDLQFTLEQQSLQTLLFHYILNQTSNSKTIIINSILMQLVSDPKCTLMTIFDMCHRIVEDNKSDTTASTRSMTDKEYIKNMAGLLKQICVKYPKLVSTAKEEEIIRVIRFAANEVLCAVSGNDYIAFIVLICNKIKQSPKTTQVIQEMLMNKKMHVASYRQVTRLQLYTLLLRILSQKKQHQLDVEYLNKVIMIVQDEKDPRNISYVFQIYSILLNRSKRQNLIVVKKKLFDCLQMYYPIDFEGDADQHNIKLTDIAEMLDQCLTHHIFAEEVRALLMIKMGAAPVGKYINTFILTRNHPITEGSVTFWINLLKRTSQQQYIQQQYQQNAAHTLSDLIIQLLNRLVNKKGPISLGSYKAVTQWLNNLIGNKIMDKDQNSKCAPFIITSLKSIMSKCNNQVRCLVATYAIHSFISHYKSVGDIIYKLGILVPVLQNYYTDLDTQKLLILTLSQIFYQHHQQPQPKLIILKLFMTLSEEPTHYKMITKTNIHKECINNIKSMLGYKKIDDKNMKIIKGYIDFLVQLYYSDENVYEMIVECKIIQIWIYGLITLCSKNKKIYKQFINMLRNSQWKIQLLYKQILINLKQFKLQPILQIIYHLPVEIDQIGSKQITSIINQKLLGDINQQNMEEFLIKYIVDTRMIYYLRHIWRPYLINQKILVNISHKLTHQISQHPQNKLCQTTIAFYNKSIQALNINLQAQITIQNVTNSQTYKDQTYRMLPIQKDHIYTAQECISWPTLLHYAWSKSQQTIRKDLIEYLPNSILTMEADRILPVILPSQDIETIAKIINNISEQTVIQVIIPFIINYFSIVNENTQVEKIVSLNKILFYLQSKSKQNQAIHSLLIKNKGKILVGIQQRLLQHRKRRARQSSRSIFSLYNSYK